MTQRPNPKDLLKYVQKEEERLLQGKLKIFLGAAPGVGKTYSMLQDALEKLKEGLVVVSGIVETHGRKETEALLDNFEIIKRHTITYHGKALEEFDLDAALLRHPGLILMDEMAHTNVPGSRHKKRWQDIIELLDKGIDVYTTVNVQHIESLNNIVTQISGIVVRETVPDTVFERAHSIELIDLPPEDLIKRLEEGKVYVPSEVETAIAHFFRKSNLTALRELALRITAEQVNTEVLLHRQGEHIEKILPTSERLLVCIGPEQDPSKLIRATFRMAKSLHAEWVAVYVETPSARYSAEENHKVIYSLRLVEQMGGETVIISGTDVVSAIMQLAQERNITRIILGKREKISWRDWFKPSTTHKLVKSIKDVDLYILRNEAQNNELNKASSRQPGSSKTAYLISILTVALCSGINIYFDKYFALGTLMTIYLLGLIFISTRGYFWPSFFASLLSVLAFDFLFVPPVYGFLAKDPQYYIMLFAMLLISQVFAGLTFLSRKQTKYFQTREQRTATMYLLSKKLAHTRGVNNLLDIAVHHISTVFNSDVIALLPDRTRQVVPVVSSTGEIILSAKEQSVAQWVFELGQNAGLGTQTLPDAEAIYVPLLEKKGPIGVLRVLPKQKNQWLTPELLHLLESFSTQIALSLEVDRLQDQAMKSELSNETDRVRNILMKYISDNMHQPLLDIMHAAVALIDSGDKLTSGLIQELGNKIYYNSEELNHLIDNLSQIAQLESSEISINKEPIFLDEVVGAAVKSLSRKLGNRTVTISDFAAIPKIPINKVFVEHVFYNILENAVKYTPKNSPIEISAILEAKRVVINIEDEGPGLALNEINRIFEKFYRGQSITHVHGMGLGLAICQKIISLHGGEIWAENRLKGGAVFRFTLPLS